jgi:hypothetical protein
MKRTIRLTESDLARIVKRVIRESKINNDNSNSSFSDPTFENDEGNKFCTLKIAKYRHVSEDNPIKYSVILICDHELEDENGEIYYDQRVTEFGQFRGSSFDRVNKNVCKYLPELSNEIEDYINRKDNYLDELNENTEVGNWEVYDQSINCSSDLF